ncbi:MAG TPA: hypothetical protein VKU19_12190 [Bryobacteraceae bacterium]|nr:hypothetical protein [Bryobacteraceae bacterium]
MVLTKAELIDKLQQEVRILLHLISKVNPPDLEYRPTPQQRSVLELLQYLTIFAPIHLRTIVSGKLDLDAWRNEWGIEEAAARQRGLEEIKAAIGAQSPLFSNLLEPLTDEDLLLQMEVFGNQGSRGSWLVSLVLCHFAAYRMQLFLYLKSCGHAELNTLNLWAGMDRQ